MKKNNIYLYTLCTLNVLSSALLIIQTYFSKLLVDKATSSSVDLKNYIIIYIVLLVSLVLLRLIYTYIRNEYSIKIEVGLKKQIYTSLINKEISEISKYHTGQLSNIYINDVSNIVRGKTQTIPNLFLYFSRILFAISALIILKYYLLLSILLGLGIIGFIFARFYGKALKTRHKDCLAHDGAMNSFMSESVSNIRLIKANSATTNLEREITDIAQVNSSKKRKRNNLQLVGSNGIYIMLSLSYAIALIYAILGLRNKSFTYGDIILIIQLVGYFQGPFSALSSSINQINSQNASIERIDELFKLKDEEQGIDIPNFDKIEISNLSFAYDRPIYNNFNLNINKGDTIIIKGTSGVGKTTLFNLLLGFLKPNSGSLNIVYDGNLIPLNSTTRSLFSYVCQENILFSGTILENLKLFKPNATKTEINNALKTAMIYDEISQMPNKLNTKLIERGAGLSIGQIQRIIVAIAILENKPIILLDEFSSALDIALESSLVNNLKALGKTLIIVSHRPLNMLDAKTIVIEDINHEM